MPFLVPLAVLGAAGAGGYLLFKEDGAIDKVTDDFAENLLQSGQATLQDFASEVGGLTLSFITGLGNAVVTGLDNAYDSIREKLGLNTENVVAGVTMAGLSIFTVIYLIGAARRGTMALE
tara:strand:+ start:684 stop:1043 length:360 start_codon:yes stop_codon:yes gene_type:complete